MAHSSEPIGLREEDLPCLKIPQCMGPKAAKAQDFQRLLKLHKTPVYEIWSFRVCIPKGPFYLELIKTLEFKTRIYIKTKQLSIPLGPGHQQYADFCPGQPHHM